MISIRSITFHPDVVTVFECEPAAAFDGWSAVVQSDKTRKIAGGFLCQKLRFKLIQKKILDAQHSEILNVLHTDVPIKAAFY